MAKNVVFLGSYMHCIFGCGNEIPKAGETLLGHEYFMDYSGKGSTQAMMCARMGSRVEYIGRLGADEEGALALSFFKDSGLLKTDYIRIDQETRTGVAIVLTDSHANNAIMVIRGANDRNTAQDLDEAQGLIKSADIMGFVLETNADAVEYGIKLAHRLGVKTFLDPSPVAHLSEDIFPCITYIKPNEYEAGALTGIEVTDAKSAVLAGERLLEMGVQNAIITMGKEGSVLVNQDVRKLFKSPQVQVVDTTSAGDVFGGALLAMVNQGSDLEEAIVYASCAGALATTVVYPILDVIPMREAVEAKAREYKIMPGMISEL